MAKLVDALLSGGSAYYWRVSSSLISRTKRDWSFDRSLFFCSPSCPTPLGRLAMAYILTVCSKCSVHWEELTVMVVRAKLISISKSSRSVAFQSYPEAEMYSPRAKERTWESSAVISIVSELSS